MPHHIALPPWPLQHSLRDRLPVLDILISRDQPHNTANPTISLNVAFRLSQFDTALLHDFGYLLQPVIINRHIPTAALRLVYHRQHETREEKHGLKTYYIKLTWGPNSFLHHSNHSCVFAPFASSSPFTPLALASPTIFLIPSSSLTFA